MHLGLLTAPFPADRPLADIAAWAADHGYQALEVASGEGRHLDPTAVVRDGGAAVRRICDRTGIRISGLEYYRGFDYEQPAPYQQAMRTLIEAAALIGAPCVTTFAGFPAPGLSKLDTIRTRLPAVFAPLGELAQARGVAIAFENWFATNLQHLGHFDALVEALPAPCFGFNFDPSHLCWQGIDYRGAAVRFATRIRHTHAKDVAVDEAARARLGVLEGGWWEYVIPGLGVLPWGPWVRTLASIGYRGVLSVEHEDRAFGAEEGFLLAQAHLAPLLAHVPVRATATTHPAPKKMAHA